VPWQELLLKMPRLSRYQVHKREEGNDLHVLKLFACLSKISLLLLSPLQRWILRQATSMTKLPSRCRARVFQSLYPNGMIQGV
jgi:hypothetical protein